MAIAHRTLLAQAARPKGRGAQVVRPAVEAVLAAAMALGAGQAGWHAVAARTAAASGPDDAPATDRIAQAAALSLEVSPFAPTARSVDALALGQLDLLRVTGVRMAADPARSGAILTMSDGKQQAFLVGQEVLDGIRLVAVNRDAIVVAHAAGERTLAMPMAQTTGLRQSTPRLDEGPVAAAVPAGGHGTDGSAISAAAATDEAVAVFGAAEQAWFAATLRNPVLGPDGVRGYRLADSAPVSVTAAGAVAGDVVEAINGAPVADTMAAIAAVQRGGPLALTVRRPDGALATVRFALVSEPAAEQAP